MKPWILLLALAAGPVRALPESRAPRPSARTAANVILVTLDGVRWEEFLGNRPDPGLSSTDAAPIFPYFWSRLAPQGVVYGDGAGGMTIANSSMVSLPAYQSIMAGLTTPCSGNYCGRIKIETFPERLARELRLSPSDVTTFATWKKIALAVEHAPRATSVAIINPSKGADAKAFADALGYLKARRPRFLYISLGDADEWGHANNYPKYLETLREYDSYLGELDQTLRAMGDYGANTTLIVTTDHGRGKGKKWKEHAGDPDSRDIWLYARGPTLSHPGSPASSGHTHLDIRPTVEALLGLCPASGPGRGRPLPELVPEPLARAACLNPASAALPPVPPRVN